MRERSKKKKREREKERELEVREQCWREGWRKRERGKKRVRWRGGEGREVERQRKRVVWRGEKRGERWRDREGEVESLKKKMLSYSCHPSVTAGTVLNQLAVPMPAEMYTSRVSYPLCF